MTNEPLGGGKRALDARDSTLTKTAQVIERAQEALAADAVTPDLPSEILFGAMLRGSYGKAQTAEGRLTDAGGAPIVGAAIEVSETPSSLGARTIAIASVHTGSAGSFKLTVPGDAPSAHIILEYRSHMGDVQPAATQALAPAVPASPSHRLATLDQHGQDDRPGRHARRSHPARRQAAHPPSPVAWHGMDRIPQHRHRRARPISSHASFQVYGSGPVRIPGALQP